MKTISFLSLLSLLVLLTACNKDKKNTDVGLDDSFEIDFDQTAFFKDGTYETNFKFVEVLEDSRCPEDAICIWEGRAKVRLDVNEKSIALTTYNSMDLDSLQSASFDNYTIKLLEVKPYPKSTDSIKDEDYSVVLEITKN